MGNQNSVGNDLTSEFMQKSNKTNKYWSNSSHMREFIINHFKNNKHNDTAIGIESLDKGRLVFVNLRGFYNSWHRVPSVLLYTSLLLMPLKQKWIKQPSKYVNEIQKHICIQCQNRCSDIFEIKDFIHLLQWKDSQGLVLWILDALEVDETSIQRHQSMKDPLIAHFWYKLSAKLQSLYDHINDCCYKPLIFDERYWMNKATCCSKYNTEMNVIFSELYFVTMKPDTMQEIIYQSNPKSLRPVVEYGHHYGLLKQAHSAFTIIDIVRNTHINNSPSNAHATDF